MRMFTYLHVLCCFDNSRVSATIEIRLARNDSYVLWHQQAIFTSLHKLLFFDKNAQKVSVLAETAMHGCSCKLLKGLNLLYKDEKPSVYIFGVTLLTRSSRHGWTQDLVCVIAMVSGTSKFVFINF